MAVALLVLAAIALQSLLLDLSAFPLADMAAVVCAAYAVGAHAGRRASILGLALTARRPARTRRSSTPTA